MVSVSTNSPHYIDHWIVVCFARQSTTHEILDGPQGTTIISDFIFITYTQYFFGCHFCPLSSGHIGLEMGLDWTNEREKIHLDPSVHLSSLSIHTVNDCPNKNRWHSPTRSTPDPSVLLKSCRGSRGGSEVAA